MICGHPTRPRDTLFNEGAIILCPVCRWSVEDLVRDTERQPSDGAILEAARRAWAQVNAARAAERPRPDLS